MQEFFRHNIISIYGDKGRDWLAHLPLLQSSCVKKWQLIDVKVIQNLSFHYVVRAFSTLLNKPVALKIRIDDGNFLHEKEALIQFNGRGSVKLYDFDETTHALLLEYCQPGISLLSYFPDKDYEATKIACDIIKKIHAHQITQKNYEIFPKLSDSLKIFDSPFINHLPIDDQHKIKMYLKSPFVTSSRDILLHGDLHHGNILLDNKEWKVIDPKGVIGNPVFEVASFICNPLQELINHHNWHEIVVKRINTFSRQLSFDKREIKVWSYIRALLGACWSLQDKLPHEDWLELAKIIDSI